MTDPHPPQKTLLQSLLIGAGLGAVLGLLPALVMMGPELFARVFHAATGGQGESAIWGEPVFYLVVMGVPLAAGGSVVGALVGAMVNRLQRAKPPAAP